MMKTLPTKSDLICLEQAAGYWIMSVCECVCVLLEKGEGRREKKEDFGAQDEEDI